MGRFRPRRPILGRLRLPRRLFAVGRGSCRAGANGGSAPLYQGRRRLGRCTRFLPGLAGRCASCRGCRCGRGNIPAGPGRGIGGPLGGAGRLSCGTGLGGARSGRSSGRFRGSARVFPPGDACLIRLGPRFWSRRPARVRRPGWARRNLCRRTSRPAPTHGHTGLGGGLGCAVHRTAARGMSGSGGLARRPRFCRAGLRAVGLPRRGAFRRHSCYAGMGSAALGHCPCGTGPETACPRRTRRRRIGCAGGWHIAVGMPGSRGHRASPGLLGPSAAPGSVCPSAAGMILLSGCLGRIFLPGAGLLGGALLSSAVVCIPAAATRSAEVLGAVPGPAVPPIATKGASAAKGTAGLPAGLRPAPGCL